MVDVPGGRPGAWVAIAIIGLVGAGALRAMHAGGHAGREAMIGRGLPEASGH